MLFLSVFSSLLYLSLVLSQNVTITPSVSTIGNTVTGTCSDDSARADLLVWSLRRDGEGTFYPLEGNSTFQFSEITTESTLTLIWTGNFQYDIAGTYQCNSLNNSVDVSTNRYLLTSEIGFQHPEIVNGVLTVGDVEVTEGAGTLEVSCNFQSAPVFLNLSVEWCLQPYVFPYVDTSRCIPLLNNSANSTVSPTSNLSPETIYSFTYRFADVQMDDAGTYRCNVSNGVNYKLAHIRVRVRDRLEILWPAIGIMVQFVIVAICILGHYLWDTYKEKQAKKLILVKENRNIISDNIPLDTVIPQDNVVSDEHCSNEVLIKVVSK